VVRWNEGLGVFVENFDMDVDTTINGLAHELWAIAQGVAPIDDVVTPMMVELHVFAESVRSTEQKALLDCRTCRNHTTNSGGCISVLRCVQGSAYQRAGVRKCWDDA
jgi:hypothetical protein